MLKNASGRYCYRYTPRDKWYLDDRVEPDNNMCSAAIVAKEGPLPVGAHTWQCWHDGMKKWMEGTLTVGLLVRPLPALPSRLTAPPPPPPPHSARTGSRALPPHAWRTALKKPKADSP